MKQVGLICVYLLMAVVMVGQSVKISTRSIKKGDDIFEGEALCVIQNREGVIYVSTRHDLNIVDGNELKRVESPRSDVDFANISKIMEDDQGVLWLWNIDELLLYNPKTRSLKRHREVWGEELFIQTELDQLGSWKRYKKRVHYQDEEGTMYFRGKDGRSIVHYHSATGFVRIPVSGITDFSVETVTKTGDVVVGKEERVAFVNTKGEIVRDIGLPGIKSIDYIKEAKAGVICLLVEGKNRLEDNYLLQIDKEGTIDTLQQFSSYFIYINEEEEYIWNLDHEGYHVYKAACEGEDIYKVDSGKNEFNIHYVNRGFVDRNNVLWVAWDKGVLQFTLSDFSVENYFTTTADFTYNNSVRGIWVDSTSVYANLEMGGFFELDKESGDIELLDQTLEDEGIIIAKNKADYWGRALWRDKTGLFWIGGRRALRSFDKESREVTAYCFEGYTPDNNPIIDIWTIYEDEAEDLWLGIGNGLVVKRKGEDFLRTLSRPDTPLGKLVVYSIQEAEKGRLWLCTSGGVFLYDKVAQQVVLHYASQQEGSLYLPVDDVKHLLQVSREEYWLATTKGLIKWNPSSGEHTIYDTTKGLASNNVVGILMDGDERVWGSTEKGLFMLNQSTGHISLLDIPEGLHFSEFNRISFFQSKHDSLMYFGGMGGVAALDPQKVVFANSTDGELLIKDIQIYNNKSNVFESYWQQYNEQKEVLLGNDYTYLNIDFIRVFDSNIFYEYEYRLVGLSNNWTSISSSEVQINKPPYGEYTLEVSTTNSDHKKILLSVPIHVPYPWYYNIWYQLLVGGGCAGLLIFYIKYKAFEARKREEKLKARIQEASQELTKRLELITAQKLELEQLNLTKDKIFGVLGHDLRKPAVAFNGLSKTINYLVQKKDYDTLSKIGAQIEKNGLALRKITDNLLSWALLQREVMPYNPKAVVVLFAVEDVITIFDNQIEEKQLNITINVTENHEIFVDYNTLAIILLNVIDNAIKFTPTGGAITIAVEAKETLSTIIIQDTGVGIAPEKLANIFVLSRTKSSDGTNGEKGTGLGMHLIHDLILHNNGHIKVKSKLNEGATFEISFPRPK